MTTKITGLSALNVRALREVERPDFILVTTATTARFDATPAEALAWVNQTIAKLPGRAHPKASLHAVARKLKAQALNGRQDVPSEPEQTLAQKVVTSVNQWATPYGAAIHGEDGTTIDVEFPTMFKAADFVKTYELTESAVISGQNRETFTDPVLITISMEGYARALSII